MAWRGAIIIALFLIGSVTNQRPPSTTTPRTTAAGNRTRELEPVGTGYHPLRHHQRPNDTSKLVHRQTRSSNFNFSPYYPIPPVYSQYTHSPPSVPFHHPKIYPNHFGHKGTKGNPIGNFQDPFHVYPGEVYFNGKLDHDESTSTTNNSAEIGDRYGYTPPIHERPPGGDQPVVFPGSRPGGGASAHRRNPFRVEYGWTEIDFTWPSPQARRQAIDSGAYQPHNIIPLDVDVYHHNGKRKIFVTMPRGDGVPVALATVSSEGLKRSPKLAPYPNWSWHGNGTCDRISSVYRVQVDECGRLWVLDRGDDRQCTPQLLLFNLKNDQLVSRYRFPLNQIRNGSNLITVSVDIRHGNCAEAFAYIADVTVPAIIVFDARHERSWRVEHPSFAPIEQYATYRIAGREFYLTDGVFGLALGPLHGADRVLYYHPLASIYESWVRTSVLRRAENFAYGRNAVPNEFRTSRTGRSSQSAAEVMDPEGILFSGLLSETAITCWNSNVEFGGWNLGVAAINQESLQFPSGIKYHDGRVWTMTSRYQNFATDTMDWNDINYRILSAAKEDLVRGTICERSRTDSNILG